MDRDGLRSILSTAKVGIAGAGGLGSNCAASLVRAGLGSLVIADFDTVSLDNLDRQFYFARQIGMAKVDALAENLAAIAPDAMIETHRIRLDAESLVDLFSDCAVVVEAVDEATAKEMIVETVLTRLPKAQVVAASGLAGLGSLGKLKVIHKGRLHICGDFKSEVSPDSPPFAPRVAIVANMEADVVLRILAGVSGPANKVNPAGWL
ncbi:MAG: sulfur carrier protein ThiS adenylyltransferase ThiF [Spirochaetes bacterium]|nr:sulfur carrier protein ThiS adenylyltransferase ThiF [Spirochaetota bacterium]